MPYCIEMVMLTRRSGDQTTSISVGKLWQCSAQGICLCFMVANQRNVCIPTGCKPTDGNVYEVPMAS